LQLHISQKPEIIRLDFSLFSASLPLKIQKSFEFSKKKAALSGRCTEKGG